MVKSFALAEFLTADGVVIDVRSPSEYQHAHIPGAVSLPLFTDAERAVIGTLYKRAGHEAAVEEGLRIVGPKLASLVTQAKQVLAGRPAKVHCWRGGMRSGSVAWLLNTAGLTTITLEGGYKTFRQSVCRLWNEFAMPQPKLLVLGGMTGSGKTVLLEQLRERGEQVINLEEIAKHRGSSFGRLDNALQPSQEQFENTLALSWQQLDPTRPIWIEDESRLIGHCQIPPHLYECIKHARSIVLEKSLQARILYLVDAYGRIPIQRLVDATRCLERRLGGQTTQRAIDHITSNQLGQAVELILGYYDRTYAFGMEKSKRPFDVLSCDGLSNKNSIEALLRWADEH